MLRVVIHNTKEDLAELRESRSELLSLVASPCLRIYLVHTAILFTPQHFELPLQLIAGVFWCVLAIRVHRFVLCRDHESPSSFGPKVLVCFIGVTILTSLAATLPLLVLVPIQVALPGQNSTIIQFLIVLLAALYCLYLMARLSLLLPDRALGRRETIETLWSWSARRGWKLTAALFLPGILLEGLITLIAYPIPAPASEFVVVTLEMPLLVFQVVLLSVAYRALRPANR